MEEQEEYKNLHLRLFGIPKIIPYVRPYLKKIVWMVIFGVVASLIDSIYPLLNSYILNHYVVRQTLDTLPWFLLTDFLIVAVQSADNFVTTYWCGQVEMSVDRDLRNAAFNHLQTLSFSYFSRNNVGYIHARVMSDTGKIGEMMAWRIMDLVWNSSYIIFVLVMMFLLNAKLAAAVALLLPAAVLLIVWFQKHLITLNRKIREINSRITGEFNEGITGAASIKSLVVEDKINRDFQEETKTMKSTSIRATHYSALLTSLVTMFSMIALAIVLWRGGILTMGGVLLVGTLSAFMSYAIGMIDPITNIINTISALIAIQVNIERLTNLLETQSDVSDTPEVIEKYGDTFNLKVPQGTNVAIVGETGAGKSTLVNLVCRFYEPTEGQVLIDGRDVRERSQLWLHSNIGYVLQTPHLFSGTVRENLRYGKPDATDEEIMEALRLVSAEDVVRRMENGLDSEVGEGGDMLSTGEKQLLSFARAILADPRILVLDEATASIDTVTEKKIQNAIAAVIKGRTSFVIAHRLSTIVDADVILVVHDGRIIERGTHRELMMKKGYYYNLYTRQYEDLAVDMA